MKPKIQHENGVWYLALFPEKRTVGGKTYEGITDSGTYKALKSEYETQVAEAIAHKLPVVNPEIIYDSCLEGEWYDWPGGYEVIPKANDSSTSLSPWIDAALLSLPDKEPVKGWLTLCHEAGPDCGCGDICMFGPNKEKMEKMNKIVKEYYANHPEGIQPSKYLI